MTDRVLPKVVQDAIDEARAERDTERQSRREAEKLRDDEKAALDVVIEQREHWYQEFKREQASRKAAEATIRGLRGALVDAYKAFNEAADDLELRGVSALDGPSSDLRQDANNALAASRRALAPDSEPK